ncbi:hypothetical protein HZS_111 [Henneguya salminicola]|nr:hypothetical protein HZS_111 [Henneguya salminicola]
MQVIEKPLYHTLVLIQYVRFVISLLYIKAPNKQQIPIIISSFSQNDANFKTNAYIPAIQSTFSSNILKNEIKRNGDKYDFENAMYNDDTNKDLNIKSIEKNRINDLDENLLSKLFYKARYFVVKSNNFENVHLAKKLSVWATPPANEKRLDQAFHQNPNIFLIFSVRESGVFQGYARIHKKPDHSHSKIPWSLPPTIDPSVFSGIMRLDWITKIHLPFLICNDLRNPYNDNKEVKISRDGQELEPKIGEQLCRLFQLDPSIDIEKLLTDIKIDGIHQMISDNKVREKDHTPSSDRIIAKSREASHRDHHSYNEKRKSVSPKNESNVIPQVFFDKLIELTNLPYEEYVAAVSNGRQINVFDIYNIDFIEARSLYA